MGKRYLLNLLEILNSERHSSAGAHMCVHVCMLAGGCVHTRACICAYACLGVVAACFLASRLVERKPL